MFTVKEMRSPMGSWGKYLETCCGSAGSRLMPYSIVFWFFFFFSSTNILLAKKKKKKLHENCTVVLLVDFLFAKS